MGIRKDNKPITGIYYLGLPVVAVYARGKKVWPDIVAILSCYAAGYWQDEYPWTDDTPWVD